MNRSVMNLIGIVVLVVVVVIAGLIFGQIDNFMRTTTCINDFSGCLVRDAGLSPDLAEFIAIFLGVILVATFPSIDGYPTDLG